MVVVAAIVLLCVCGTKQWCRYYRSKSKVDSVLGGMTLNVYTHDRMLMCDRQVVVMMMITIIIIMLIMMMIMNE